MDNFSTPISAIASTYGTDTIFILGKGPSADSVPAEVYAGSLVIGINDAERIYPADISIFHADWVKQSLAESGARARLYLTSTDFQTAGAEVVRAEHVPLSQESGDLMMQRLLGGDFVIEDVLLISALQVARKVAEARGRPQTVYLVGFDFRADMGSAHALGRSYENDTADQRRLRIDMQENFLLNALYMLRGTDLDVVHVGDRSYSRMTTTDLRHHFLPGGGEAERPWAVSVIAELTTNHFGDRGRLERMVRAAKAAGANFVKIQKRDVESFYSREQLAAPYKSPFGTTFADYRHQLELSDDDFGYLDGLCKQLGIQWFASALDVKSYRELMDLGSAMIKLPSTISEHTDYLSMVARTCDRPIVLSTGMTDKAFENWVLETFKASPQLYLLQCNSAYPTPAEDCNVGVVRHYDRLSREQPQIVAGYSSHDAGWFGSALAVAAGARMVEKHVKLGNTEWAHFDAVALDLTKSEFKDYVAKVREAEIVVGSEEKDIRPSEHHKYRVAAAE
ncbi:N-acetylneuraminate synthase family protein [Sphingobium sp. WCS2017Hpa-17]|uniref:N-acetylneuraminate synthase family protein n=1 Tax=Sphingobium sp. WCS2017Hpa-17 TaxID=3073638 RepID=UPI002889E308|nr:N-acetylneuraminate synthase family protein [Sphingobium sp. WCS2017Hpa-17]